MVVRPLDQEDLNHVLVHTQKYFTHFKNARLFITGGTGLFGHWLLESLLNANHALNLNIRVSVFTRHIAAFRLKSSHIVSNSCVTFVEGDIRNLRPQYGGYTHVIHAATDTMGREANTYELAESIIDGTRRVIQFALANGVQRFLYISSGAVYGRGVTDVSRICETYSGSPDPLLLQSSYGEAKRMAEHFCLTYSYGTILEPVIARCFAFVGPHLPLDQHFAIGNFIRDAMAGRPIRVNGDGTPLRSFLYMSDLAVWLWTMLAAAPPNRAFNVGSNESISISELAALTAECLSPGLPAQVEGRPTLGAAPTSYVPDITRAEVELGLTVRVSLAEAIRKTAAWHNSLMA